MIPPSRPTRRAVHAVRSQAALELGLTVLAIAAALLLLRVLFAAFGVSERVLAGSVIYGATAPLVLPVELIPAGRRPILGDATLADITAAVLVTTVPLYLLGRRDGRQSG